MKKKNIPFLVLSLLAFGLSSCDPDDGGITNPKTENISLQALSSIMDSFTSRGLMSIDFGDGYLPQVLDVYVAMDENAMEDLYNNSIEQVVNNEGYQCAYIRNVNNKIELARYTNTYGEYLPYDYSVLKDNSESLKYLRTIYFEKTETGTYVVTNQMTRNLIAETLASTYYSPDSYANISEMELIVENDKITSVNFKTDTFSYVGIDTTISYDLTISGHGTTTISPVLQPYSTYPEAAALGEAFKKIGNNVDAELSVNVKGKTEVINSGKAHLFDDLYYLSFTQKDTSGSDYTQEFGYLKYPEKGGYMQFTIDEEGAINAGQIIRRKAIENSGAHLQYDVANVAPEMFKYSNGKYVTRSPEDVALLASYVVIDFDGVASYADEIAITLNDDGEIDTISYELSFYTDYTHTTTEVHQYKLTIKNNENKTSNIEGLSEFKQELTEYSKVNEDLFGSWTNSAKDRTVDIRYCLFNIDDQEAELSINSESNITGTIGEHTFTVELVTESSVTYLEISEDGGEKVRLYRDEINSMANELHVNKLLDPKSEDLGVNFYFCDDSILLSGQSILYYDGEKIDNTTISAYFEALTTNTEYKTDVTDSLARNIISSSATGTMAEYLTAYMSEVFEDAEIKMVAEDANNTLVAVGTRTLGNTTYLMVWIICL